MKWFEHRMRVASFVVLFFFTAVIEEMDKEFREIDADFSDLGAEGLEGGFGVSELDSELDELGDEFEMEDVEGEEISFESLVSEGAEGQVELQWFHRRIRRKVRRYIRALIRWARRYRRCTRCLRELARLLSLYRRRRFLAALRQAWRTYRCFRRCARG